MSAHTPGPWTQYESDPLIIIDSSGASLGEMSAGSPNVSRFEQIANARLIAAAPELLGVAAHAEAWISDMPHGDNCYLSAHYDGDPGDGCNCGKEGLLNALQAAIAKATGEQS